MHTSPWALGLLAGVTIFLGFPVARIRRISTKTKALLNALSTGILIFLLVEITGHALEAIEELVKRAAAGQPGLKQAFELGGCFVVGFTIGLLGLVYFEHRFLGAANDVPAPRRSKQVAVMIALGLGLHNFSEGLAIGQGYASGAFQLAWLLAIGFALHNATEGFGIAAPLSGHQVSWNFLGWMGLLAGGPTLVGAAVGGWWVNKPTEVFCLALAAGTILYVVGELLHLGRQLKEESVVAVGLLGGFFIAVVTDFLLMGAMTHGLARGNAGGTQASAYYVAEVGEHGPRHGGYFGDADDLYHYEVVFDAPSQLRLYVNDSLNRPLNVLRLQGRWTLDPDNSSPRRGSFRPSLDGGYFLGTIPPITSDTLHVEVAVLKGQQWVRMEFYLPASQAAPLHATPH